MIYLMDINGNTSPDYFRFVSVSHSNPISTQSFGGHIYSMPIHDQETELKLTTTKLNLQFLNQLSTKIKKIEFADDNNCYYMMTGCYLKEYAVYNNVINVTFGFDYYNVNIDSYKSKRWIRKKKLEIINDLYANDDDIEILDI